jgi:hypothetical protein
MRVDGKFLTDNLSVRLATPREIYSVHSPGGSGLRWLLQLVTVTLNTVLAATELKKISYRLVNGLCAD